MEAIMKFGGVTLLIVLIVAIIGLGPLLTIWSLNTLFGLKIAYTIWTWLAAFVLQLFFFSKATSK